MNSSNPWDGISTPDRDADIRLLRVDAEHPWDLYWGRSSDNLLLVARLRQPASLSGKLPSFRGLRVSAEEKRPGVIHTLLVELLDLNAHDVFQALCTDIIKATRVARSEQHLVNEIVSRTWMWHRFLQKGHSGRLTAEEQRGLIGELTLLSTYLVPLLGPGPAVDAWTGPTGTAKDFERGASCIEVKARRAAALPFVEISSEFQLDSLSLQHLYLAVVDVTAATDGAGLSLANVVDHARSKLQLDGEALEVFDERTLAAGYIASDDYSDWSWAVGDVAFFRVEADFPAIRFSQLQDGISRVEYRLSLQQIKRFETSWDEIALTLGGQNHGSHA